MADAFLDAVEHRRTYYAISDASPIPDDRIQALVERALKHVPSSFNVQSGRVVILLGNQNKEAWRIVADAYAKSEGGTPEEQESRRKRTEDSFANCSYGSVLFLEDQDDIESQYAKMPHFRESKAFDVWSENSTGMLHFVVWTALESEGLGASLQHHPSYIASVGDALKKHLSLPPSWKPTALMPFGTPVGPPGKGGPKAFKPIEDRLKVLK